MNSRIVANNEIFSSNPEAYIKSIFGNEITNLSYKILDIILPNDRIIIDVQYDKIYKPTLETIYIKISDLQPYGLNSNTAYIFEYKGLPVYLNAKINQYKDKIPVRIYPYDKGDKYYSYVALIENNPLHAYATIVKNDYRFGGDAKIPEPSRIGTKELYDEEKTIENYKNEIKKFDELKIINTIKLIKSFDQTLDSNSYTGFVIDYNHLPNKLINGHIIIIPKRKSNLLFYYPNSSNPIYPNEIEFIKRFMKFDQSNLE